MTKMTDTEGEQIPEAEGGSLFNLTLSNDGMMSMAAPAFSTDSGEYTARAGVLEVSLRDVFDDFLSNETNLLNSPDDPLTVATLLREYATKFEAMAAFVASTEPLKGQISAAELHEFEIAAAMVWREFDRSRSH